MNTFVRDAISNTKKLVPDYWQNTLKGRLCGGVGSIYEQFNATEELEKALVDLDWEETTHPDVMPGCRVFKANLKGRYGIVKISDIPDTQELIADDRKNTGCVAMTVKGVRGEEVSETYLIIGKEQDEDVVFTFHPGEPIRPSVVKTSTVKHQSVVTKAQALELGFDLAKIV